MNSINVLSNHSVISSLECGQYCLRYKTCQGFNYKSARMIYEDNDINCQLSKQSNMKQNNMDSEWMYYKALHLVSLVRIIRVLTAKRHWAKKNMWVSGFPTLPSIWVPKSRPKIFLLDHAFYWIKCFHLEGNVCGK